MSDSGSISTIICKLSKVARTGYLLLAGLGSVFSVVFSMPEALPAREVWGSI